ncbi:hypothetical protein Nmel_011016 [Mimus melanotis]
MSFRKSC